MGEPEAATIAKSVLVKIGETPKINAILTKKELLEMSPHASVIPISVPVATRIASKEISSRVEVTRDPSKGLGTSGGIDDFSHYFRDRFQKLVTAFRARQDARDATTI